MLTVFQRLEAWFLRRSAMLDHPRAPFYAALLVPLLLALQSLLLGQDDGWDMRNYHLYNPYALLNGRLALDFSPAGFQSYFNPLLDLPYYLLTRYAPGAVAGFVFGWLHGLNFIPLSMLARQLLPERQRAALLLALAGCLGAGFLSELGNSMGDNLTSLLVLWSVLLVLRHGVAASVRTLLLAGLLMGAAAGLKLTNINYAVALCLALLVWPQAFWRRIGLAWWFGVGVLAGLAVTAGWWWATMWRLYGNPLFPQFNDIFRSPLAAQLGVLDTEHLPHTLTEAVFWPFVFTRDIARIAEVPLRQFIWPLLMVLLVAYVARRLWCRYRAVTVTAAATVPAAAQVLLVFTLVAYLIWLKLFSIYRYLVPLELLAPLLVWLLCHGLMTAGRAQRVAGWALTACVLYTLPFVTWGHSGWTAQAFRAEAPQLAQPQASVVYMVRTPMAWLTRFFQPEVAFMAIGSGFPESGAYLQRLRAQAAARTGQHYVMLPAAVNIRQSGAERKLALARALGLTASAADCTRLAGWLGKVRFQVEVQALEAATAAASGQACTLVLQPQYRADLVAEDAALQAEVQGHLAHYGLMLQPAGCRTYPAYVGTEAHPYRLCPVQHLPPVQP
ncbi:hypothetical protein [Duganella qianjiadongensis]|uniref:DUF2029 domain-containing protein n=1 Tax=Duganella qianjiadongensis TaxID=2692176 RepID=A0ABW9VPE7_9BURK|nr:hypothetical protein [Duganella qianjiadongensis]MYM41026.1 hypothetical protein [Duganella qianjiadongensis]